MCKKLIYLTSFVLVLGLGVRVANAKALEQDYGPDGIVSVEAEHYDNKAPGKDGAGWEEVGPEGGKGGFTGVTGMEVFEGANTRTSIVGSARLDYEINFVKTGTHYVWILAYGPDGTSDSCHAGLDGEAIPTPLAGWPGKYVWAPVARPFFEVTSTGVHTFNIWMREANLVIDKIVLTTNPNFTLSFYEPEPGPPESPRGARVIAFAPIPADGAIDVPRDIVLGWIAGAFADKHDVYFGTVFDDVNQATTTVDPGGVYQDRIAPNIYALPERLAFGKTYYWRVDEVNAPPDNTIRKAGVWSFTTEPIGYPIAGTSITATASSSSSAGEGPENTINGSGLYADDLHSTESAAMWLSSALDPNAAWIQYEFDRAYKLHQMLVWNHNSLLEPFFGLGVKDAAIEYSVDGNDYTTLDTTHEFDRGSGADGYAPNTTVGFAGAAAKYVRITVNSNWGDIAPLYGLSEVRFFSIPVQAREPSPDSGATDVDVDLVLSWRAGREAAEHDVYISTDEQAVIDSNVPVSIVTEAQDGPISLDLGETYYWKVNEVNEAETPTTWQGDVWNFSTSEYLIVDDFEAYNDLNPDEPGSNRIFNTWIDGYGNPAINGSVVGHADPPFAEQSIVHGGDQSMPFFYDNTGTAAYSEGERTFAVPQDWTQAGVQTLVLYFYGTAGNTGQLYVKVSGVKVAYPGDAADIEQVQWNQWSIDLASLNPQSVTSMIIGIDDSGASGTLYFDDIRLYRLAP